jgi:hypothetical protein
MRLKKTLLVPVAMSLILGLCGTINGQEKTTSIANDAIGQTPGMFNQQLNALGKRLKTSGKEKTVYSGQLFDKAGNSSPARVIYQLPGLVRLEGFKKSSAAISFNGQEISGITSRKEDEALMEVFVMDYSEGMLASVQQGAAVRLLGRGFGPDPRLVPDYKGPRYDIYEVTGSVRSRQDQLVRSKLYYFDSATGLLQSTRYYDRSVKPAVKVETRFSNWGDIEGSAYPACVDHYVGGKLVFSFIAESIEGGASIDKASFK